MEPKIYIINGLGGSGKDTFCSLCKEYAEQNQLMDVYIISIIDGVKEIAKQAGWNGGKDDKDRIFLSELKLALEHYNNYPTNYIFNKIDEITKMNNMHKKCIFIHMREQINIEYFLSINKNVKTIKVINNNVDSNEVPKLVEYIKNSNTDYTIYNNGTIEDLKYTAQNFVNNILIQ